MNIQKWMQNLGNVGIWSDLELTDLVLLDRIMQKSYWITLYRDGVALGPQRVHLELASNPKESQGTTVTASDVDIVVFGYKDHPDVEDTNIARGDWFWYNNVRFDIIQVLPDTGNMIIATAKASEHGV